MQGLFSEEMRRNPYPLYDQLRRTSPVHNVPPPFDACLIFDYPSVKRVLNDHEAFSSRVPAPPNWFIFFDPPAHTKLRGLISQAFTPRVISGMEQRIRELSRALLDTIDSSKQFDLATEYSVPLPMRVIAGMIGMPDSDQSLFEHWSDVILKLSYTRSGGDEAAAARRDFMTVQEEMVPYIADMIADRRSSPRPDLLSQLVAAELNGEHLSHAEILGFFQLLVVAGQETTSNLINNAILCLLENPDQLQLLKQRPDLLPNAIEEVLRYRSPLQWMMRTPRQEIEIHGVRIAPGRLVLPMIGSANRDPQIFTDPERFDIQRDPNPHVAFGHGIHFCLGAALSRMEARIAVADLLQRFPDLRLAGKDPWPPRAALHVHGPASLPVAAYR